MTYPENAGRREFREKAAYALRLLNQGFTPEEVEDILEAGVTPAGAHTALSDPTNVLMQEVIEDGSA